MRKTSPAKLQLMIAQLREPASYAVLAATVGVLLASTAAHANDPRSFRGNIAPPPTKTTHFFGELEADTSLGAQFRGFGLHAGMIQGLLGFDLRGSFGSTHYGAISVSPDPASVFTPPFAPDDPNAEIYRARSPSDSWSYTLIGPGIIASGNLFSEIFPRLGERARFGFDYGRFTDGANNLSFSGLLINLSATLSYQLGPNSPYRVEGSVEQTFGGISNSTATSHSSGDLPVSWVSASLGLSYWF